MPMLKCIVIATILVAAAIAAPTAAPARGVVYLAPVGPLMQLSLPKVERELEHRLGVTVRVLPAMKVPASAYDRVRRQLVGEELSTALALRFPTQFRSGTLIGLTERDMYLRSEGWRYAFGTRGPGAAIVSVARMDPRFYRLRPDPWLLRERAGKMLTKDIGILLFGLAPSQDPRSVLYTPMSLDDLDFMTLEFSPKPFSPAKRRWLAGAEAACGTASSDMRKLAREQPQTPDESLAVIRRFLVVEQGLADAVAALKPVPEDSDAIGRLRRHLREWLSFNRAVVGRLAKGWDQGLVKRWVDERPPYAAELTVDWLTLGSHVCALHFET